MSISVGTRLPEQTFVIDRAQLVRYAGASGDFNPIHWDEHAAKAAGLPGVLAHGMLAMALAGRVLTDWLEDPGQIVDFRVRFAKPLPIAAGQGVAVTGGGEVAEIRDDGLFRVSLRLRSGDTEILTRAAALVRPRDVP